MSVIASFVFFVYLFTLAVFDWKKKLLPVEPMMIATVASLLWMHSLSSFIGFATTAGFIWIQVFVSKGKWMGRGDIWYAASIGAWLGWPSSAAALYLTYVVGGLIAALLYCAGIYRRGMRIPFAPFLALGAAGAAIWGSAIAGWFAARI